MPHSRSDSLWQNHAKQWHRIASPLRPCPEDVDHFRKAIGIEPGRSLLLGVTPELAGLSPDLTAIDHNAEMIDLLWKDKSSVVRGDWLNLPFPEGTFDTVIGDGCLTLLSYPVQYSSLFVQLRRVLSCNGKTVFRLFICPEVSESCEVVCKEALDGKIGSFHAFKWRLSMAIASASADHTLAVSDVYHTFSRLIPDHGQLAASTGWHSADIETINVYRESRARYSFPTLPQLRKVIAPYFDMTALLYGHYELADRCPILTMESCA